MVPVLRKKFDGPKKGTKNHQRNPVGEEYAGKRTGCLGRRIGKNALAVEKQGRGKLTNYLGTAIPLELGKEKNRRKRKIGI